MSGSVSGKNRKRPHAQHESRMVAILFIALTLTPGCTLPMMGMHGMHRGQDKHEKGGGSVER